MQPLCLRTPEAQSFHGPRFMTARSALSHRNFRILWLGSVFGSIAYWVQQVSLGWVGYQLTGSVAMLGFILGARALPTLLLAPLSGVAADRYDRKRLLIATQLANALAGFLLAGVIAADALQVWHLFLLTLVNGATGVFERNLRHALVLDLVPREIAVSAVALNNMSSSGARVLAPAIAGGLLVVIGARGNFLLQGLAYIGVTLSLLFVHPRRRERSAVTASAWASLKEGMAFSARNPTIRVLVASGIVPYLILIPAWGTLLPVYAKDIFDTGPQSLGLLYSAVGLGGFIGGVAGAYIGRADRLGLVSLGSLAVFTLSLLAIGFSPTLYVALPFVLLAGAGEILNIVANQTLMQMVAPEAMRGRVTSLIAVYPAFISLGSIPIGAGAEQFGTRGITIAIAILGGLACAAFWMFSPRLRDLRLSHHR